ncbi:hypothetical protein RR48_00125 [Papilio machaon]|uniref:Uncharacterized protein n=1 Tax=Papilio machaon TaxID=76193 RepID=A0A0N1IQQ2_PAPMA|nr:hypothetical protein RR48_00125 [Papilio machaon]
MVLQIAAFVMARRLATRRRSAGDAAVVGHSAASCSSVELEKRPCGPGAPDDDSDVEPAPALHLPPGSRKNANLRMYTILDKIF